MSGKRTQLAKDYIRQEMQRRGLTKADVRYLSPERWAEGEYVINGNSIGTRPFKSEQRVADAPSGNILVTTRLEKQ